MEGIANGQNNAISFGNVNVGDVVEQAFAVKNLGNATLVLGKLKVPTGFTIVTDLPNQLSSNTTATFRVSLDTRTVGVKSGTLSFTTNDSDESVYNFKIEGTVNRIEEPANKPITSNHGNVLSFQIIEGTSGSVILKTVQNYNANGNNIRLYADFLSRSGTPYRTDVLIGSPNSSYGDHAMPKVASIDQGRYVIAWQTTSLSGQTNIRYSIMDAYGSNVGSAEQIREHRLLVQSEIRERRQGFERLQLSWLDLKNNKTIRRNFNMSVLQ